MTATTPRGTRTLRRSSPLRSVLFSRSPPTDTARGGISPNPPYHPATPARHRRHPRLVERQPIAQRRRQPRRPLVREIRGIRLEHIVRALTEQLGEPLERRLSALPA